eukprot:3992425-Pyramimonas_sp.AAC.1
MTALMRREVVQPLTAVRIHDHIQAGRTSVSLLRSGGHLSRSTGSEHSTPHLRSRRWKVETRSSGYSRPRSTAAAVAWRLGFLGGVAAAAFFVSRSIAAFAFRMNLLGIGIVIASSVGLGMSSMP